MTPRQIKLVRDKIENLIYSKQRDINEKYPVAIDTAEQRKKAEEWLAKSKAKLKLRISVSYDGTPNGVIVDLTPDLSKELSEVITSLDSNRAKREAAFKQIKELKLELDEKLLFAELGDANAIDTLRSFMAQIEAIG